MNITTENLEFYYDSSRILKNVSVSIGNKEFVGIIGPNGSGKSTLLKCIYRVLRPANGEITVAGKSINTLSIAQTSKLMAVVAQHNDTSFDFTVMEMVLLGRSPHKKFMERDNEEDYKMVEDALEKVGMLEFKNRSFNNLSGGEKQRIILARALVQNTDCLILDEPTNHLDIRYQLQIMRLAKNLDGTIISAIHDLNIAAMYCDKIYALKDGKIVGYGTPKEVLTLENIYYLYGVRARIIEGEKKGQIHIIYEDV